LNEKQELGVTETPEERERLLSQLSQADRDLVERVMAAGKPPMTAAEAIEFVRLFGCL